jgi:Arc/MetJ-type ribon-helix-helix transcriptional regulator
MYSHVTLKEPAMSRLIRKQIYIEPEQDAVLKRRARELGVSESEVIRRGIETLVEDEELEEQRAAALAELMKMWAERSKLIVPQTGRTWTRDDLYEERFERYGPDRHEHSGLHVRPD